MADETKRFNAAQPPAGWGGGWINILCSLVFATLVCLLLYHTDYAVSVSSGVFLAVVLSACTPGILRHGDDRPFFVFGTCGVLLAVALACAPLWHASWSVADDYMIPLMLNKAGGMTLPELLDHCCRADSLGVVLGNTSGRFQPAFVLSYAVNTFLLGSHIRLWYILYALLFFGSVLLLLCTLRHFFDGALAVVGGALLLAVLPWHWLFRDTGVVEVYGLFGLSLTAWVMARNRSRPDMSLVAYVLLTVGNALTLGTKETFLVAALPPLAFLLWRGLRPGRSEGRKPLAFFALNLVFDGYIVLGIAATLAAKGSDTYGRTVGPGEALATLGLYARLYADRIHLPLFVALLGMLLCANGLRFRRRGTAAVPLGTTLACCGVLGVVFLFGLSQYVFYHGAVDNQHYAVPFAATPALLWIVLAWYFLRTLATLPAPRLLPLARAGVCGVLGYWFLVTPAFSKDIIRISVETSQAYDATLQALAARLSRTPDRPLVLVVGPVNNAEIVISPAVYLKKHFHVPNAVFVAPAPTADTPANPARQLAATGYVDVIAAGRPPQNAPAFTLGIAALPAGGPDALGQLLPLPAASPALKLLPGLSYPLW